MKRPNSRPGCTHTAVRSPRELVAIGVRGLLRCGAAPPPILMRCFRRPASGSVPDVRSSRTQASTSAQVRTTLTHVHSHSARVFAYAPAFDGARWRVPAGEVTRVTLSRLMKRSSALPPLARLDDARRRPLWL